MSSSTGRTLGVLAFSVGGMMIGGAVLGAGLGAGIGYMAGSVIGQTIFPPPKQNVPPMADYPIQQVSKGHAVPGEYGTARMAGTLVWMGELHSYKLSSGGKGGGGGSQQTMYYRSFLFSICEGTRTVTRIWKGKHEIDLTSLEPSKGARALLGIDEAHSEEITIYHGDGENAGLQTLIGQPYSNYRYDCCVLFQNYELGASDSIPAFVFEVSEYLDLQIYTGEGSYLRQHDNETFTKTTQWSTGTETGHEHSVDIDREGYVLATTHLTGRVALIDPDGNMNSDFFQPSGGWIPEGYTMRPLVGVRFTRGGAHAYAYVLTNLLYPDEHYHYCLYKFSMGTGQELWRDIQSVNPTVGDYTAHALTVDDTGHAYVYFRHTISPDEDHYMVRKYTTGGETDEQYLYSQYGGGVPGPTPYYTEDILADSQISYANLATGKIEKGFIFAAGWNSQGHPVAGWQALDGMHVVRLAFDSPGAIEEMHCILTRASYIFIGGDRCTYDGHTGTVFKFDIEGNLIASYDSGSGGETAYMSFDREGHLIVKDFAKGTFIVLNPTNLAFIESSAAYEATGIYDNCEMVAGPRLPPTLDANPADIIFDLLTNTRYGARMPWR